MAIKNATPYLILNGHADQAIEFYRTTLGAEPRALQRFGDNNPSCPEALKKNVMHCELRFGEAVMMLSDGPGKGELPPSGGVHIALDFDDAAQARSVFDALASGGTVEQKLIEAPWGALFGSLRDRFGVQFMFNAKL